MSEETISLLDRIKTNYLNTIRVRGIFIVGVAVFFGAGAAHFKFLSETNNSLVTKTGFWAGLILISILPIFAILETIIWVIPPFSPVIKVILNTLLEVLGILKFVYVWFIKLLIRGAVEDIVLPKKSGQEMVYIFEKQEQDDHYYPDIVNLENQEINLSVQPSQSTKYWRFGFKFSKNDAFIPGRHGVDYPLIHLTKETAENKLRVTYYNDKSERVYHKVIIEQYSNEEIEINVKRQNQSTKVVIKNGAGEELLSELIGNYSFSRIFAWGDGNPFVIPSKILIKT